MSRLFLVRCNALVMSLWTAKMETAEEMAIGFQTFHTSNRRLQAEFIVVGLLVSLIVQNCKKLEWFQPTVRNE